MLTTGTQSSRRHRVYGDRLADPRRPDPAAGPALPGRAAGTSLAATISLAICTAVLTAPAVLAAPLAFSDPQRSLPALLAEGPVPVPKASGTGPARGGGPASKADRTRLVQLVQGEDEPAGRGQGASADTVSATVFEDGTAATSADASAGERTGVAAGFPASDLPAQDDARHDATRHGETLRALEAAILRLEGEIAELGRLADWQSRLLAAARTDPDGARRLRRPRSSCLKTPLAPFCDRLNGMYREEDGGRPAGEGDQ